MKAWLDDSAAYHHKDTADLERGAWKDREAEARQELAAVNEAIANLYEIINEAGAKADHPEPHIYAQLGALFAERNALDDELEGYE